MNEQQWMASKMSPQLDEEGWHQQQLKRRTLYLALVRSRLAAGEYVNASELGESEQIGKALWSATKSFSPSRTGWDSRGVQHVLAAAISAQDEQECELRGACAPKPAPAPVKAATLPPPARVPPGPIAVNYHEQGPVGEMHRAAQGRRNFLGNLRSRLNRGEQLTSEDIRTAEVARYGEAKAYHALLNEPTAGDRAVALKRAGAAMENNAAIEAAIVEGERR